MNTIVVFDLGKVLVDFDYSIAARRTGCTYPGDGAKSTRLQTLRRASGHVAEHNKRSRYRIKIDVTRSRRQCQAAGHPHIRTQ